MAQARVIRAENGEDDQYRREAERDGQGGTQQDAGDNGQGSHARILTASERFWPALRKICRIRT